MSDALDGRIGDGWSGEVPDGAHVNLVIARRGSPTAAAAAGALASPRPGHVPILVCLNGAGSPVRPATIMVNKVTLENERQELITWGAAQLGIAQGVLDAVADATLPAEDVPELVLLIALYVDPAAADETSVKAAARAATRTAIADAVNPSSAEAVRALAEEREQAANAFYSGA